MCPVPVMAPLCAKKYGVNRSPRPSARSAWLSAAADKSLCLAVSSGNPRRAGVYRRWNAYVPDASPISPKMGLHEQGLRCYLSPGARRDTAIRFLCNLAPAHGLGLQAQIKISTATAITGGLLSWVRSLPVE